MRLFSITNRVRNTIGRSKRKTALLYQTLLVIIESIESKKYVEIILTSDLEIPVSSHYSYNTANETLVYLHTKSRKQIFTGRVN